MPEIWKEIPDSYYSVSSEGRVASRRGGGWRLLRPGISSKGYPIVGLTFNGVARTCSVHRLVAVAFLGPPPTPAYEVNHIDGVKTNSRAENLEWVTAVENCYHRYEVLGQKAVHGEAHPRAKLTEAGVREIRAWAAAGELGKDIAFAYGVTQGTISAIVLRRSWAWLDDPEA